MTNKLYAQGAEVITSSTEVAFKQDILTDLDLSTYQLKTTNTVLIEYGEENNKESE